MKVAHNNQRIEVKGSHSRRNACTLNSKDNIDIFADPMPLRVPLNGTGNEAHRDVSLVSLAPSLAEQFLNGRQKRERGGREGGREEGKFPTAHARRPRWAPLKSRANSLVSQTSA